MFVVLIFGLFFVFATFLANSVNQFSAHARSHKVRLKIEVLCKLRAVCFCNQQFL